MKEIYSVYFYNNRRGMFSIVNDLIDHLYVADQKKYKLKARWIGSPYKKGTNLDLKAYAVFIKAALDKKGKK